MSKKEYLRNKAYKQTNVIAVKPEKKGQIDRRLMENGFFFATENNKSINVAKDAKAMRLNRRQMFKNAPLEDSYEPVITTKQVSAPLVPEVDLPALK